MIDEPVITSTEGHEAVLRHPTTREDVVMRPLIGLTLLGVGGLVLYMFVTDAPHPIGHGLRLLASCLAVAGMFLLFGVMPVVLGISALTGSEEIVVDSAAQRVEHRLKLAGQTVFSRRLSFGKFDSLTVEHWRSGIPVARSRHRVVATGARRLTFGVFHDVRSAAELRNRLATLILSPQQRPPDDPAVA